MHSPELSSRWCRVSKPREERLNADERTTNNESKAHSHCGAKIRPPVNNCGTATARRKKRNPRAAVQIKIGNTNAPVEKSPGYPSSCCATRPIPAVNFHVPHILYMLIEFGALSSTNSGFRNPGYAQARKLFLISNGA